MNDNDLSTDPLFVGLTRPSTILGVPYIAFVMEIMAVMVIFLAVGNPLYLLLGLPLHAVLYLVASGDPAIFGLLVIWMKTMARSRNNKFWSASSFSPLRVTKWKK